MFNKTESKLLNALSIDPTNHEAVTKLTKGEYNEDQVKILPIIVAMGFDLAELQKSITIKLSRANGPTVTGYKYVMGKSKVGMFPINAQGVVSKYGTWLHLTAFKEIMGLTNLPEMSTYVPKAV